MKTKQIKGKVDILLVDVNQEIFNAKIHGCNLFIQKCPQCLWDKYIISDDLLPVNWEFLSTIENITEEQAREILGILPISYSSIKNNKAAFEHLLKANDADDFNPKTTLIFIKQ